MGDAGTNFPVVSLWIAAEKVASPAQAVFVDLNKET